MKKDTRPEMNDNSFAAAGSQGPADREGRRGALMRAHPLNQMIKRDALVVRYK